MSDTRPERDDVAAAVRTGNGAESFEYLIPGDVRHARVFPVRDARDHSGTALARQFATFPKRDVAPWIDISRSAPIFSPETQGTARERTLLTDRHPTARDGQRTGRRRWRWCCSSPSVTAPPFSASWRRRRTSRPGMPGSKSRRSIRRTPSSRSPGASSTRRWPWRRWLVWRTPASRQRISEPVRLRAPARAQRRVVVGLLRPAESASRPRRDRGAAPGDRLDAARLLAAEPTGRTADGAIPRLGGVRHRPQCRHLFPQLIDGRTAAWPVGRVIFWPRCGH